MITYFQTIKKTNIDAKRRKKYSKNLIAFILLFGVSTLALLFRTADIQERIVLYLYLLVTVLSIIGINTSDNSLLCLANKALSMAMLLGCFYFKTKILKIYLILILLISLYTRYYFRGCLFELSSTKILQYMQGAPADFFYLVVLFIAIRNF